MSYLFLNNNYTIGTSIGTYRVHSSTVLWFCTYYTSSKCLILFSVQIWFVLSRSWKASALKWCRSRYSWPWLLANLLIAWTTVTMFKSLRRSPFLQYHDAVTMLLSTFFGTARLFPNCSCWHIPTAVCRMSTQAGELACTEVLCWNFIQATSTFFLIWCPIPLFPFWYGLFRVA